jgi:hypothetical protein
LQEVEGEFDLSLRASWGGSFRVYLLELLLDLALGLVVEGQASFEDDGSYVHLDGLAEEVRLEKVSKNAIELRMEARNTSLSFSRVAA